MESRTNKSAENKGSTSEYCILYSARCNIHIMYWIFKNLNAWEKARKYNFSYKFRIEKQNI